jgi:enediyne biosynthesis protein E4
MTITGRGAAFGDLFNNGKIDLVINALHGPPVLLRNVNADHHHWIGLKLVGGPKSPRDAIGAAVCLTSGGGRQRRDVISGGSFASSNDPRLQFGLGASNDVEKVEIHWSDGNIQNAVISAGVDRYYTIAEGRPAVVQGSLNSSN